jgi:hypothetical protein
MRVLPAAVRDVGRATASLTLVLLAGVSSGQSRAPVGAAPPQAPDAVVLSDAFDGRRLLPVDNWWNRDISAAPVDPSSRAYIDAIGRTVRLHPDFGPPPYGIPYMSVSGSQPRVPVTFTAYGSQSDAGFEGQAGYPIPDAAKTTPGFIEGRFGDTSGDRHLIVVDRARFVLFELYATKWNASAARWEADSGAIFDLRSNHRRPDSWTSADAAGLAILPGLVRFDEVDSGRDITHAFRATIERTNGYVWPASHRAGNTAGALPLGARLRLKATTDLSRYPPEAQRIFRAMQRYGLIIADNGSSIYVSGSMDPRWAGVAMNPAFHSLHADDFDVVALGFK